MLRSLRARPVLGFKLLSYCTPSPGHGRHYHHCVSEEEANLRSIIVVPTAMQSQDSDLTPED